MKKIILYCLFFVSVVFSAYAQPTAGYYNNAQGKTGLELKIALYNIIKGHTVISYSGLWNAFYVTDRKPNNKVWDMYSDKPGQTPPYEYTFFTNQCGNYTGEGNCYNREHSVPASWFNDGAPMYSDLYHLYPTDGYVNNRRGNFPFGRVGTASWTSLNGSRLGTSNYPGYSGTVFEPIDEYKGDFARSYFYMVTRYHDVVQNWSSPMLARNQFPAFTTWAINLLLEWHQADPVSQKEIDRNNAVYSYQQNRNPFIDNPDYALLIWNPGSLTVAFTSTPPVSAIAGNGYLYNISASGPGTVNISCTEKPAWLTFNQGGAGTASLSGIPQAGDAGSHTVRLVASNGTNEAVQVFSIMVTVENNAPFISNVAHTPEAPFNFQMLGISATVTNDDGLPVVKTLWGLDAGSTQNEVSMNGAGNDYSCSIQVPSDISKLYYKVKAVDAASQVAYSSLMVVDVQPNVPPTIYSIDFWPYAPSSSEPVAVRALIADDDGDEITASVVWGESEEQMLNYEEMTNAVNYFEGTIPPLAAQTPVYFKVVANDSKGAYAEGAVNSYTVGGTSAELLTNTTVSVFPNPASDKLFVHLPDNTAYGYSVFNIVGMVVKKGVFSASSSSGVIELGNFTNGTYHIIFKGQNGLHFARFVVER